jgi:nucleotide-binding universal stress UspA family protein
MAMKILVAVDLSEATPRVLQVTERVARQSSGEVRLLHVAEAEPDFIGYDAAGPDVVRDQVAKEFRDEHRSIQAYAEQLREAEAKRFEADMLIVGSHGFGALYDLLIGSISRGILKDTDIPVLVVPIRDPSLRP